STPKGNRSSFAFSSYLWNFWPKVVPLCGKIAESFSIAWKKVGVRPRIFPQCGKLFSTAWKKWGARLWIFPQRGKPTLPQLKREEQKG
ncbi:MAG TPA: hypothetical protein PKY11_08560, partial [Kiritimatiellia bacterium]|nr:hypothetical protein [Kiritimatiellia bacterium]